MNSLFKKFTTKKVGKYKNKKTTINNIEFDSKDEAKFYEYLQYKYVAESIIIQPKFELQPTFKYEHEKLKIRSINYIADFQIGDCVFDVKGFQTTDFKIKAKLFKYKYPQLKLLVGTSKQLIQLMEGKL